MKPRQAWTVVLLLALLTATALTAPWPVCAALAATGFVLLRSGRGSIAAFAASALAVNALLLAAIMGGGPSLRTGPITWSLDGAILGLTGGLRLVAALVVNLALLQRLGAPRLLDALHLPARATALLAAVVLAAHDVGADFQRLRTARILEGEWPTSRSARMREVARLLPALLVAAHRRATTRREALHLAGHATGPRFVPIVAIAALAAAGRLALLAFPNVALTYVVVFLGGVLYGARAGFLGGALGMLLTDLLLTGLYPLAFVNVPAMALLGVAGGLLRRAGFAGKTRSERTAGAMLAASAGIGGTFLFSVSADTLTWLIVTGGARDAWLPLVVAGLVFNVVPALVNGALFASAVGPTVRAWEAFQPRAEPLTQEGDTDVVPSIGS